MLPRSAGRNPVTPAIQAGVNTLTFPVKAGINPIAFAVKPFRQFVMAQGLGSIRAQIKTMIHAVALAIQTLLDPITLPVEPVLRRQDRTPHCHNQSQSQSTCRQNNLFHLHLLCCNNE
jgi:hypothetical protein